MPLLSIIIPVKDEPYVSSLVHEIHRSLNVTHEVLIQREEGISNAVWHGLRRARGEYVAVMDGDGSHKVRDLAGMVKLLDKGSLVVASRTHNLYPFHRKILSYFCAWMTRNFLGLKLKDPLTAFLVGKREIMQFNNREGCKFALEILVHNGNVIEYPIVHQAKEGHRSKLKPQEGIYLLKQLMRLKCTSAVQ